LSRRSLEAPARTVIDANQDLAGDDGLNSNWRAFPPNENRSQKLPSRSYVIVSFQEVEMLARYLFGACAVLVSSLLSFILAERVRHRP
jgi:hypothetical protein